MNETSPLVTADEIREMDRRAIEDLGIPGVVLMENAGRGATEVVLRELAAAGAAGPVAILCGPGNNGGDGYVIARHLHQAGVPSTIYLAAPAERVAGDARVNLDIVRQLPIPVVEVYEEVAARALAGPLSTAPVIVDALLGTGLRSDVRGIYRLLLELANDAPGRKVAIDIPSGIRADDGHVLGTAFRADATATFALAKLGLLLHPGADYAGEVAVIDIGIPPSVVAGVGPRADRIGRAELALAFASRPRTGHKGTFGHCLVIAGAPGKGGAALLAGSGALVTGAGLVTVATDREVQARLEGRVPELMVEWVRRREDDQADPARVEALLAGKGAVVVGPGLGATPATASLVLAAVRFAEAPVVIDADGLNVLASHPGALARESGERVLTPHPGEMARLLAISTAEVQGDRVGSARRLAAREHAVVVLKGAHTVVAEPDGHVGINTTGNPGMGTAGTGDVLAGMIGALLAQGLTLATAARVGVLLHGQAGDDAARTSGEAGLTAAALLASLPAAIRAAESGR